MNKEQRIQRILNEPQTGLLARGTTKQFLASTSVVASWVYLFTLNPGSTLHTFNAATNYQLHILAMSLMIGGLVFLRRSVRHITSVPAEYLDERQLTNRDWAYSLGYLVVRRVGLALTIALVGFIVIYDLWNQVYYATVPAADPLDPQARLIYNQLLHYVNSFYGDDLLASSADIILLLTYVAYSFPIILLAWREAKTFDEVELAEVERKHWVALLRRISLGYFRRITWVGVGVILTMAAIFTPTTNFYSIPIYLLFGTVFYALYVYTWAMLQHWQAIKLLNVAEAAEVLLIVKDRLFKIFVAQSIIGMTIMLIMVLAIFNIGHASFVVVAMAAGLIMVVLHIFAFSTTNELAKRLLASENSGE